METPDAFIIGGSSAGHDGRYARLLSGQSCNGKPVYQRQNRADLGSGGVLFQPTDAGYWMIGPAVHATDCGLTAYVKSFGNGGSCAVLPDGTGCLHRWQEVPPPAPGGGAAGFVNAPSLIVSRCPAADPCCGFDCGQHGNTTTAAPAPAGVGGCSCVCSDGYVGDSCDLPPAYLIEGAAHTPLNGRYTRLQESTTTSTGGGSGWECNGLPVYQLGGSDGMVLFQPTGSENWMIGGSNAAASCEKSGFLQTPADSAGCKNSPGAAGCVGQWLEALDTSWAKAPLVTLLVCKTEFPCCGMDCGAHGIVAAGTGSSGGAHECSCSCAPGYTGAVCDLANAYSLVGATSTFYNGRYEATATTCNGKPVYQKGGYLLLQPTGLSVWVVSPRSTVPGHPETDCGAAAIIMSANSVGCAESPDAAACAGKWQQPTSACGEGQVWCGVPALAVAAVGSK